MTLRRIAVGSDHRGVHLKSFLVRTLREWGHHVTDYGTHTASSADYPDFAAPVAQAVSEDWFDRGIVICGSGIGASISANKIRGARCALCRSPHDAAMSRRHNDANVLALGADVTTPDEALRIVRAWLSSDFEGGRHARRVGKIGSIEKSGEI